MIYKYLIIVFMMLGLSQVGFAETERKFSSKIQLASYASGAAYKCHFFGYRYYRGRGWRRYHFSRVGYSRRHAYSRGARACRNYYHRCRYIRCTYRTGHRNRPRGQYWCRVGGGGWAAHYSRRVAARGAMRLCYRRWVHRARFYCRSHRVYCVRGSRGRR